MGPEHPPATSAPPATLGTVTDTPTLDDYPARSHDKLRYGDTDRQGHVNNAVFATFLETGRVELLRGPEGPRLEAGREWVVARLALDFVSEVTYPGRVDVGTGVTRVGTSSVVMAQAIFQEGRLVARAEAVIVQTDDVTRRSTPLSDAARACFEALRVSAPA